MNATTWMMLGAICGALGVSLGAVVKPNWPFPLWIAGALWTARRLGPWLLPWKVAASAEICKGPMTMGAWTRPFFTRSLKASPARERSP